MRRGSDRYVMNLPADVFVDGKKHSVLLHDLSITGMFLRTAGSDAPPLGVGRVVHVALAAGGKRIVTAARVQHALGEAEARELGRVAGVGLALCEPMRPADHQFNQAVARLVAGCQRRAPAVDRRIVIAEPNTRLLEHLSAALGDAGFAVATATNGMEALSACMRRAPDVIVLARAMAVVDGYRALGELQRHARLAAVPVIITSDDPQDLVEAFSLGAMDFIARPFTSVEVVLRARRLAQSPLAALTLAEASLDAVAIAEDDDFLSESSPFLADDVAATPVVRARGSQSGPLPAEPLRAIAADEASGGAPTLHGAPPLVSVSRALRVPSAENLAEAAAAAAALFAPEPRLGHAPAAPLPTFAVGSGRTGGEAARDRVVVRGDLALLALPSVLSLLEQERKSGRLALVRERDGASGEETATIDILEGRIVAAAASHGRGTVSEIMMALLDWTSGEFVLTDTPPVPRGPDALALTPLLLEHARICDEAAEARRTPRPFASA